MKKYLEYIKENKSLIDEWFDSFYNGDIEKVKELINQGIDVNIQDNDGDAVLILFHGYLDIVKLLLNQPGIDINIQNKYGNTALINAASNDNEEIVELLLQKEDIDVEHKNINGKNFIDLLTDNTFIKDYQLQKKILDNGREDIIVAFEKYGLVHPKIKEENPDLFKAAGWGLI